MNDIRRRAVELAAELRPRLAGRVSNEDRVTATYATDFGRLVHQRPAAVVFATCEDDVCRTLAAARRWRVPLSVRGSGHSVNGQAASDGGVLLVNLPSRRPEVGWLEGERLEGDLAEIAARERWGGVERALRRRQRAMPVLPDHLGLSVGGTLAVGGYGVDSIVCGALVDQVERLRLILPDGTPTWCSREERSELFRFALAGLGQLGIVERVVVKTRPYEPTAVMYTYAYRDLAELVDSFAWMSATVPERPFFFKAVRSRGRHVATYGVYPESVRAAFSVPPPAGLGGAPWQRRLICPRYRTVRSLAVSFWVGRFHGQRRLWSDYLLDHQGLVALAEFVTALERRDAFAGVLGAIYFLAVRRPAGALDLPFEAAGARGAAVKFLAGFYTMVPAGDPRALERAEEASRLCLEKAVELGGRPYLYGWHRLDDATRKRLYGADLDRLRILRQELDPDGIFQTDKLLDALPRSSENPEKTPR